MYVYMYMFFCCCENWTTETRQAKSPTADFTKASISVLGYGAFARQYVMSGNSYAVHMKWKAAIQGGITAIQGSGAYSI